MPLSAAPMRPPPRLRSFIAGLALLLVVPVTCYITAAPEEAGCFDFDGAFGPNNSRTCASYITGPGDKKCGTGGTIYNQLGWGGHWCTPNGIPTMGSLKCCPVSCGNCPQATTATAPGPAPKNSPTAPPGSKNVLFFIVDDLRLQLGGDAHGARSNRVPGTPRMHTPSFSRLIQRSAWFPNAQCQYPVCAPSRTSFLTGRRPDATKVWDLHSYWRTAGGNFTSLPQYFRDVGYITHSIGKVFHQGTSSGALPDISDPTYDKVRALCGSCGGSYFDDARFSWSTIFHSTGEKLYAKKGGLNTVPLCPQCGNSWAAVPEGAELEVPMPDTEIANEAIRLINTKGLDEPPWFMAVGFRRPHLPFACPERFWDYYADGIVHVPGSEQPPKGMPDIAWSSYSELRAFPDIKATNISGMPGDVLPTNVTLALRRAYFACVSHVDEELGRIVDAIDNSRFAKDTVITLVGDHGFQLGEHGEWGKHTLFGLSTNTPMIVHVPGMTGFVSPSYTELVDLFPTVVEAALGRRYPRCNEGVNPLQCTDGMSLIPMLRTKMTVPTQFVAMSQFTRCAPRSSPHAGMCYTKEAKAKSLAMFGPVMTQYSGCRAHLCQMGYSIVTSVNGSEYRYTEWVDFNINDDFAPDFSHTGRVATELYNLTADSLENVNLFGAELIDPWLVTRLGDILHMRGSFGCNAGDAQCQTATTAATHVGEKRTTTPLSTTAYQLSSAPTLASTVTPPPKGVGSERSATHTTGPTGTRIDSREKKMNLPKIASIVGSAIAGIVALGLGCYFFCAAQHRNDFLGADVSGPDGISNSNWAYRIDHEVDDDVPLLDGQL